MIPIVLRAVPWRNVVATAGVAAVLGAVGVAVTGAGPTLLAIAFALLAASAAGVLDEPSSVVVDITPTSSAARTAIRALAILVPAATGAALITAGALRGPSLPWTAVALALAGNILLGFAAACVVRTRIGEPGPRASVAVLLILILPGLIPAVARRIQTFPTGVAHGPSAAALWWPLIGACALAIVASQTHAIRQSARF
jgi:hypothetical protein